MRGHKGKLVWIGCLRGCKPTENHTGLYRAYRAIQEEDKGSKEETGIKGQDKNRRTGRSCYNKSDCLLTFFN